jgi:uncharacterized protein (DUF2147 family)
MRNVLTSVAAITALTAAILGAVAPASAGDPAGKWLTKDGNATVNIARCGEAMCGTIVALKEPNDPASGKPKTDGNNPDAAKRSRSIIGLQMFEMKPGTTADQWDGQLYNAEDGKTYTGSITLTGATTLDLKGCAFALLCKTQTWTRTK